MFSRFLFLPVITWKNHILSFLSKELGIENPHIVCICPRLDSFGPSHCLNVTLSRVIYHNKFFEIFCLHLLRISSAVFQQWVVEIRAGKAPLFYKYKPRCNMTLSNIFYFSFNIRYLARIRVMLSREEAVGVFL